MLPQSFTPELLRHLELLKIHSRRSYLGTRQGGHPSLKRGHGIEFADFRKYEPGDSPREIDWNVYARSDRLYVKRFREEQALTVLLILDGSASMSTPAQDRKWSCAREIALALAYVALMARDTIMLSVLGGWQSPVYSSGQAVHELSRQLNELTAAGSPDIEREMALAASRVHFPGVAVFISDFLLPLAQVEKACNLLRAKNLDITAVQILGHSETNPFEGITAVTAVDSETGEEIDLTMTDKTRRTYERLLEEHNSSLKSYFASAAIAHTRASSGQHLGEIMINNLSATGLLQ
jgi:uncharacterized protein (DUF58 family)